MLLTGGCAVIGLFYGLLAGLADLCHLLIQLIDLPSLCHQFFPCGFSLLSSYCQFFLQLPHSQIPACQYLPGTGHLIPHEENFLLGLVPLRLHFSHLRLIEFLQGEHVLVVLVVVLVDVEGELGDVGLQGLDGGDGGVAAGREVGTRGVRVRWGLHVIMELVYYIGSNVNEEGVSCSSCGFREVFAGDFEEFLVALASGFFFGLVRLEPVL